VRPTDDRRPRVLVVEDDRFLRRVAEAALQRQGFVVTTAADGEEALEHATRVAPDVILLDLVMPKMQGLEVLRRLKRNSATASIPVIVLTSLGQDSDVQQALAAGAAGYLVKRDRYVDDLTREVQRIAPPRA
jgi:CheY-like chemotaxis protein